jgi:tetratricopeptide (TPR) repeat protein
VVCATGCITPALREPLPSDLGSSRALLSVPFHEQAAYECGPAALAMALEFSGRAVAPAALAPQTFTPSRKGSLQADLIGAARRNGRIPFPVAGGLAGLLREVAAGHPVVVLQNLGLGWIPVWHYAVAIGFDLERAELILHSGPRREYRSPLAIFDRTWARSERWGQVILAPGELPHTLDEAAVLEAIAAFERVDPGAVLQAYEAASARFPASAPVLLGLGNARYRAHDLAGAESAFRSAAELPGTRRGPALNNLAHVLAELGRRSEAREAIERAIALGDPWRATYQRTLEEIAREP